MNRTDGNDLATPILDRQNLRGGMTKREEFAKAAMVGILASGEVDTENSQDGIAELAVKHADALIEALNKVEP